MRLLKNVFVLGLGAVAVLYILNPTAGILDEAGAILLLTNVLAYYGIDLTRLFDRGLTRQ